VGLVSIVCGSHFYSVSVLIEVSVAHTRKKSKRNGCWRDGAGYSDIREKKIRFMCIYAFAKA
jgi:hypothetical protein